MLYYLHTERKKIPHLISIKKKKTNKDKIKHTKRKRQEEGEVKEQGAPRDPLEGVGRGGEEWGGGE